MTNADPCVQCPAANANNAVEVIVRDQYGRQVYHPHNDKAHLIAELAGTKTLTPDALKLVLKLGYELRYVHPPVEV